MNSSQNTGAEPGRPAPEGSNGVMLITGAAGSLGQALTEAAMAAGYDTVLIDRERRGLERLHDRLAEAGRAPALYPLDLAGAGPEDYLELAAVIGSEFGRLDVLVHAAADFTALHPLEHQPPEEWMKILQGGVTGPFLLTRALLELLRATGNSRMVWVLDQPDQRCGSYWGAYGVSQSARQALSSILRAESRASGPRVIDFLPPPFKSPLRSRAWPAEDPDSLESPEAVARLLLARVEAEAA